MAKQEGASSGGLSADGDHYTVEEVTYERGTVDFGDRSGLVEGNVTAGGVIRGSRDLLVKGSVEGDSGELCSIEIDGRAVVEGPVSFARIQAREIVAGAGVADSRLTSDLGAEVAGNLARAQVSLGQRRFELRSVRDQAKEHGELAKQLGELRIKIAAGAQSFVRDYPEVNLRMGDVFVPTDKELKVDLTTFYSALKDGSPAKVDTALEEFYLKVVVGILTRGNRDYIQRNPNRHTVFLKLIGELRKHVTDVRSGDRMAGRLAELDILTHTLIQELCREAQISLRVDGRLESDVTVQFLQFSVPEGDTSTYDQLEKLSAEAKVRESSDGTWILKAMHLNSEEEALAAEDGTFENGSLVLDGGRIAWHTAASGG